MYSAQNYVKIHMFFAKKTIIVKSNIEYKILYEGIELKPCGKNYFNHRSINQYKVYSS